MARLGPLLPAPLLHDPLEQEKAPLGREAPVLEPVVGRIEDQIEALSGELGVWGDRYVKDLMPWKALLPEP